MGTSSSSEENTVKEKLLGDEIQDKIISEIRCTMEKSKTKSGIEKSAYEKKITEMLTLQEKFEEYRKLVEEIKDQKLEQMRSDTFQLEISLEENKRKFDKIKKEKEDLEHNLNNKSDNYERIVRDLKEKLDKTEKILSTERDKRISVEKNVMEMKTLQMNFEVQTKKTEALQKELESTRATLLEKIKLNMEVEAKFNLRNSSSGDESTKVLRETIDKQNVIIKQVQETINEKKVLQMQLDCKINEIELLKQQLKQKETEM